MSKIIKKLGYPPSYVNEGETITKATITSKRRIAKETKTLARRRNRRYNTRLNEQRREQDLLNRDISRGHTTTRVKRLLRRAAYPKETVK